MPDLALIWMAGFYILGFAIGRWSKTDIGPGGQPYRQPRFPLAACPPSSGRRADK